jgi:hypothetical protein
MGGAEHVHPHDPLELLVAEVRERAVRPDAGVGHEHVDRPELGLQLGDRGAELVRVGHVRHGDRAAAGFGHHCLEVVAGAGDQAHPGALRGGGQRHGAADAARGAGDHRGRSCPLHGYLPTTPRRERSS